MFTSPDAVTRGTFLILPTLDASLFAQTGAGRQIAIVIGLAAVAIVALLVAGAAYLGDQRRRPGIDDEELFTTTPLPVPKEELARMRRESQHHAFGGLSIPRWVQGGSVLVALAITYIVAQRVRPHERQERSPTVAVGNARDLAGDSPEDLDLVPDSSPAFAFRARWESRSGGGCAGMLEVTQGEPNAWSLTARVHDGQGQLIDTALAHVTELREGQVVEFSFPRVDCERIGAWDVRGARAGR